MFQARRRIFSHSVFPDVIPGWTARVFIGGQHPPLTTHCTVTLLTERYSRYPWASMLELVLSRYSVRWLPLLAAWAMPWSVSASSWPSTTSWWWAGPSGTWRPASAPDWSGSTVVTGTTPPPAGVRRTARPAGTRQEETFITTTTPAASSRRSVRPLVWRVAGPVTAGERRGARWRWRVSTLAPRPRPSTTRGSSSGTAATAGTTSGPSGWTVWPAWPPPGSWWPAA